MPRFFFLLLSIIFSLGLAQAQVELTYCTSIEHGYGDAGTIYTPYMQFPAATVQPYAGATVSRVLIGLNSSVTNVTLYIKNAPQDTRPLYTQAVGELQAGWNEVELSTPYVIPAGQDLSIGYRARLTENGGIGYSDDKNSLAQQIFINQTSKWTTCGGAICMRAILEGDALPAYELQLGRIADLRIAPEAESIAFTGTVHNMGTATISEYVLNVAVDGESASLETFSCQLPCNATDTFTCHIPNCYDFGQHSVSVSIVSVDGQPDAYSGNNTSVFQFTIPNPQFSRRTVCEEYTGLWCGWCPKGLVGLEIMKEAHPDHFIAISIHGGQGDQLEIPQELPYSYYDFWTLFTGAPQCKMDRRFSGDPFDDIQRLYDIESATDCHLAVQASAMWDADSTHLTISTELLTDIDVASTDYNIAYVVLEDGITGYIQTNYFSGNDTPFYGWEQKEHYTRDVVFNDVARGIFPSVNGTSCGIESFNAFQAQSIDSQIELPAEVSNPAKVHVVSMIIDTHSGYIVNAHNVWPVADPAAIHSLSADDLPFSTQLYNLDGSPCSTLPRSGIYIERQVMSDGSIRSRKVTRL